MPMKFQTRKIHHVAAELKRTVRCEIRLHTDHSIHSAAFFRSERVYRFGQDRRSSPASCLYRALGAPGAQCGAAGRAVVWRGLWTLVERPAPRLLSLAFRYSSRLSSFSGSEAQSRSEIVPYSRVEIKGVPEHLLAIELHGTALKK